MCSLKHSVAVSALDSIRGLTPEDCSTDFRLDRSHFSVARLTDPDDALQYWLSRPVEERLCALELLRRTFYGIALARDFKGL